MEEQKSFLGTGWAFPPTFTKNNLNTVEMISGVDDVKESLMIILTTSLGERVMKHKFGASLESMMFENMDVAMLNYVKTIIDDALLNFEPRIKVHETIVDTSSLLEGKVMIDIEFTVASENTRTNIVFPFYLNEGTDII